MTDVQWFDDHVIDTDGRRYALSVPWTEQIVGDIPACLLLTAEERAAAWANHSFTDSYRGGKIEDWQLRERQRRAQLRAEKKERSAKSLAAMKAKHVGEHWDSKAKLWVKDEGNE